MKLTILGNNGAFTGAGGACSGYLVTEKDTNILLDIGPGTLANLQKFIGIENIDAIILSHLHYDHTGDIFILKYAVDIYRNKGLLNKTIKVYCPSEPVAEFERIKAMSPAFEVISYDSDTKLDIGELNIWFNEGTHPVRSFACSVKCPTGLLVYTGDTSLNENIAHFSLGADILLIDAGLKSEDKTENPFHLTAGECGMIADEVKPGLMLLSHIMPLNDHNTILAEAQEYYKNCEIAEILNIYYI